MATFSKHPDPEPRNSARERIDALLDEALKESFPASDSCSISSSTQAIKQDYFERNLADVATVLPKPEKDTQRSDKQRS